MNCIEYDTTPLNMILFYWLSLMGQNDKQAVLYWPYWKKNTDMICYSWKYDIAGIMLILFVTSLIKTQNDEENRKYQLI